MSNISSKVVDTKTCRLGRHSASVLLAIEPPFFLNCPHWSLVQPNVIAKTKWYRNLVTEIR